MQQIDQDGASWLYLPGVGLRKVEVGAANSAGTGYRTLRVTN